MTEMERGWRPFFENLRLYLAHFPGQRATSTELSTAVEADVADVWQAVRREAGTGTTIDLLGMTGEVHQSGDGALLARVDGEVAGLLGLHAYGSGAGQAVVVLRTWLFGDDAPAVAERERAAWQAWLDAAAVVRKD